MTEITFRKATKAAAKLRLALTGPSSGGKTYTALAIGTNLGKRVALVDTEKGSAVLYADKFDFDSVELPDFAIDTYLAAIRTAAETQHDVLIIDGLSPAWDWLKDYVDLLARSKFKGNSWSAWSEGTPMQNALVGAILSYPGHVIVTMRTKTEWSTEKDERSGRVKPVKVGLAPQQRDGIDYEWTIVLEMSDFGIAKVGKTRWDALAGKVFEKPGRAFAQDLLGWLTTGEDPRTALIARIGDLIRSIDGADMQNLMRSEVAKAEALPLPADVVSRLQVLEVRIKKRLSEQPRAAGSVGAPPPSSTPPHGQSTGPAAALSEDPNHPGYALRVAQDMAATPSPVPAKAPRRNRKKELAEAAARAAPPPPAPAAPESASLVAKVNAGLKAENQTIASQIGIPADHPLAPDDEGEIDETIDFPPEELPLRSVATPAEDDPPKDW